MGRLCSVGFGSTEGQGEAAALLQCDEANTCAGDQTCLEMNCSAELAACFTGPLDCAGVLGCVDACGDDDACRTGCFYEGTTDARAEFGAILACIEMHGCVDDRPGVPARSVVSSGAPRGPGNRPSCLDLRRASSRSWLWTATSCGENGAIPSRSEVVLLRLAEKDVNRSPARR